MLIITLSVVYAHQQTKFQYIWTTSYYRVVYDRDVEERRRRKVVAPSSRIAKSFRSIARDDRTNNNNNRYKGLLYFYRIVTTVDEKKIGVCLVYIMYLRLCPTHRACTHNYYDYYFKRSDAIIHRQYALSKLLISFRFYLFFFFHSYYMFRL